MGMAEINTHAGNVRLIGGRLCLNFVNTADDSRRWCSMEDCGNHAKARRHYTQRRAAVESADSAVARG